MDGFFMEMTQIEEEDYALTIVEVLLESLQDEKGLKKELLKDFFTKCLANLENPTASPKTKFYTIFMLKQLSNKDKLTLKIFGVFSAHKLYSHIQDLAFTIDPKKSITEKGKNLFPSEKDTGNKFIRIILECFVNWGTRFPTSSNKEPTKFKKTLNRLNQEKVVVPKDLTFFLSGRNEKQQTPQESKGENARGSVERNSSEKGGSKGKDSKDKYASEIKFIYNKIDQLLTIIEEETDPDVIEREIQSYHLKFEKDLLKFTQNTPEMLDGQSQDVVALFFKISEFLNQENNLFKGHATQNDYQTYASGFQIAYEKIFEAEEVKKNQKKVEGPSPKTAVDSKSKVGLPPKDLSKKQSQKQQKIKYESVEDRQKIVKKISQNERPRQNVKMQGSQRHNKDISSNAINVFFSRLDTASKSPNVGFKSIAVSLDKEKKSTLSRRKINHSNYGKNSKFATSSLARSNINLKGIFANPPNLNPPNKKYQGELVLENIELEKSLFQLKKDQGSRRFKMSSFRQKYVLFESSSLQIGFKTEVIYEKIDNFSSMIGMELYLGNKTTTRMQNVEIYFQGDKNSLIYTNPQTIDRTIFPESQIKIEIMNIPKCYPFGLINMRISYELQGVSTHTSTLLPNTILKMVNYYAIQKQEFPTAWSNCSKILKSEPFKLFRYFPPDNLTHLIPELTANSSYSQFIRDGSSTDYELGCEVIIQDSFQGILKINIRPDLHVVVQVGLLENDEAAIESFRFYLQTLQMLLKDMYT